MENGSTHAESNGHANRDRGKRVSHWTKDDVAVWLREKGFTSYVDLLAVRHSIDGIALLNVSESDLRRPPVSMINLGDIKRLALSIKKLKENPDTDGRRKRNTNRNAGEQNDNSSDSSSTDREDAANASSSGGGGGAVQKSGLRMSHRLNPEFIKLAVAYVYMFVVFMLTSFVMVVVHDRVPDMDRYPPLPDIVLDNLPYIPWAFELCELTAVSMSLALIVILFFHKHRFIIMRRIFALTGTVFMLRCITMLITSLSVPGIHLQCQPKVYGNIWTKLERAMVIWTGFGMSLKGVRSCGDYMFSGHTVIVTLLNHFITEYTPRHVPMLHTVCWVLNIFAIFFILAAHEHYSIDVFIAFYITSRLFLYYHSLANSRVLRQPDRGRTRSWFPLFSYFESSIDGSVPNDYEWPLPTAKKVRLWFKNLRSKRD